MDSAPGPGIKGYEHVCPFLRQYTTGERRSICLARREPFFVSPGFAISCCRDRHHVTCSRYIMACGRLEAELLFDQDPRATVLSPVADEEALAQLEPDGSWLLAAMVVVLGVIVLFLGVQVYQGYQQPVVGAGPEPPAATVVSAPTATQTVAASPTPVAKSLGMAVVEARAGRDSIFLYREPSEGAQILRTLRNGERMTLLEGPHEAGGSRWWRIEFVGRTGWVREQDIRRL
jgi:hypothetical protein